MRVNEPVTGREYPLEANAVLMSTTDIESHIRYANAAFIEASGYSSTELFGNPHNIIRHPDMPAEAFADMWATLKADQPWSGLVKNRCANGDHYWVRANAVPVNTDGTRSGYVSVRTTPTRAEVDAAETLYTKLREKKIRFRRLHKGELIYKGWLSFLSLSKWAPIRLRIWGLLTLAAITLLTLTVSNSTLSPQWLTMGIFGVLGFVGWALERQLVRPIKLILGEASAVASGKRPSMVDIGRIDELGMIMRSVTQSGLNLVSLAADVDTQVEQMNQAIGGLSNSGDNLSESTLRTASSLQETAAALTQISSSIESSATNATQVSSLSDSAAEGSRKGAAVVNDVTGMMERIQSSSKRINEIVKLIDSIAFKTNLLALNAAVEAARAGEAGRGFAVVASEVRELSKNSSEAAHEIRELIEASRADIDDGSRMASNAGESMASLNDQIAELSTLNQNISTAMAEQCTAVNQINAEVNQLDEMTNNNSNLVDESTKAVSDLQIQAQTLSNAISLYAQ